MSEEIILPEYKVQLERVTAGENAIPDIDSDDMLGQRTKLGGRPSFIQDEDWPVCMIAIGL